MEYIVSIELTVKFAKHLHCESYQIVLIFLLCDVTSLNRRIWNVW